MAKVRQVGGMSLLPQILLGLVIQKQAFRTSRRHCGGFIQLSPLEALSNCRWRREANKNVG